MDVNELGRRSEVVRLQDYNEPRRCYLLDVSTGTYQTLRSSPKGAAGYAVKLSPEPSAASADSGTLKTLMSVFTDGHTMFLSIGPGKVDLKNVTLRVSRRVDGYLKRSLVVEGHGREVAKFAY